MTLGKVFEKESSSVYFGKPFRWIRKKSKNNKLRNENTGRCKAQNLVPVIFYENVPLPFLADGAVPI